MEACEETEGSGGVELFIGGEMSPSFSEMEESSSLRHPTQFFFFCFFCAFLHFSLSLFCLEGGSKWILKGLIFPFCFFSSYLLKENI